MRRKVVGILAGSDGTAIAQVSGRDEPCNN